MAHTRNTSASPTEPNRSDARLAARSPPLDERSERALSESMTVRRLPDRRYVVDTDGGTYVVDLDAVSCTCPDHAVRGARCKHLRRAALSVTAGVVPADDRGSHLCARHAFEPGTVVSDRETGKRLVVTAVTTERADAYRTDADRPLADYESNAAYGAHEPAVEAVYVESLRPGTGLDDLKTYAFPASRLTASR